VFTGKIAAYVGGVDAAPLMPSVDLPLVGDNLVELTSWCGDGACGHFTVIGQCTTVQCDRSHDSSFC